MVCPGVLLTANGSGEHHRLADNGTLDPAAAINQSPTDLINSVKDAAQKASSGIFGKAANATTQQSPTALNQNVQYVNLEK